MEEEYEAPISHFQRIQELSAKSIAGRINWTRSVVTLESAMFGALVALNSSPSLTCVEHYLFLSVLALQALCILSGVLILYNEVAFPVDVALGLMERERKRQQGQEIRGVLLTPKKRLPQKVAQKCFPWLFGLSLCALFAYAVVRDRPTPSATTPEEVRLAQ